MTALTLARARPIAVGDFHSFTPKNGPQRQLSIDTQKTVIAARDYMTSVHRARCLENLRIKSYSIFICGRHQHAGTIPTNLVIC
jgi:hypothetical protein